MPRSVPLSVRISDEDAAFLARFRADGATTPSEKLRALLAQARSQERGHDDIHTALELARQSLEPARQTWSQTQREEGQRSDLIGRLYDRLPELNATLAMGPGQGERSLREFEADCRDQIFGLIEDMLDFGLTGANRTYDADGYVARLTPILKLCALLREARSQEGGTDDE